MIIENALTVVRAFFYAASNEAAFLYLQAVILLAVFRKILCFRLWRDSLQRVVTEPAALMGSRNDTVFLADHLFVADFSGVLTIGAETINFFAE